MLINTYDKLYSMLGRRPTEEEYSNYMKLRRRKVLSLRAFCRRHNIVGEKLDELLKEIDDVKTIEELEHYNCKFSNRSK